VATVAWTTERVMRRILPEEAAVEWVDPSASVSLVEHTLGAGWSGHRALEIDQPGVRLVALSRLGTSQLPHADLVVQDGDVVYLAVAADALERIPQVIAGPPAVGHH
jgi:trk system potassium uptake protein TrkA